MRSLGAVLTQRGSAFLTAGAILFVAGLLLGQPDLTRIGALLLALLVGALLMGRLRPSRFTVTRSSNPARLTVDQPTVVIASLVNTSSRPSTFALAEEELDPALGDRPRFVIPPTPAGNVREVEYTLRPHVRGVHELGPLRVWLRDPFGLTSSPRPSDGTGTVLVAPRIHPLVTERALGRGVGADGAIPHQVALHGEDDQSIREYREGDDLRRIHWPATARTGAMMVRQEDRPARRRAVILLDSRRSAHRPAAAARTAAGFEWSVTMAASIAAHVDEQGYAVHLLTADPTVDSGVRHDNDVEAMLETLARIDLGSDDGLPHILRGAHALAHDGGLLVILTPGMGEDDIRALASLRPAGSTGLAFVTAPSARGAGARESVSDGQGRLGGRRRRGSHDDRAAGTTLAVLSTAGWRAVSVRSTDTPMQAWSMATATQHVGAR
ncbi:MAG TPA: DUF58 domain-containing protein [Phycicoccus sp.]|nr:DUF58 domain-containing protein [Phycicoccus sp.]